MSAGPRDHMEAATGEQIAWFWAGVENKFQTSWSQEGDVWVYPDRSTYVNGCWVTIDRDFATYHLLEIGDQRDGDTWVTYMFVCIEHRRVKAWEWCDPRPHKFFDREAVHMPDLMLNFIGWYEAVEEGRHSDRRSANN